MYWDYGELNSQKHCNGLTVITSSSRLLLFPSAPWALLKNTFSGSSDASVRTTVMKLFTQRMRERREMQTNQYWYLLVKVSCYTIPVCVSNVSYSLYSALLLTRPHKARTLYRKYYVIWDTDKVYRYAIPLGAWMGFIWYCLMASQHTHTLLTHRHTL
jgi:hypothetical protein